MATSNARAVKAKIITDLTALAIPSGSLDGVQVAYAQPRNIDRQWIYGGKVTVDQEISSGRTGADTTREETATILLHIRAFMPGATCEDAETRALVIGAVLEGYFATTGPVVTGLLDASVAGWELDSDYDDDAALADLTYQIRTQSWIT